MTTRTSAREFVLGVIDEVRHAQAYVVREVRHTPRGLLLELAREQSEPRNFTAELIPAPESGPDHYRLKTDLPTGRKPIGIWHSFAPFDDRRLVERSLFIPILAENSPLRKEATFSPRTQAFSISLDDRVESPVSGLRFEANIETPEGGPPTVYVEAPLLPGTNSDVVAIDLKYTRFDGEEACDTRFIVVQAGTREGIGEGKYTFDDLPMDAGKPRAKVIVRSARIEELAGEQLRCILGQRDYEVEVTSTAFPLDISQIQRGKSYIAVAFDQYERVIAPALAQKISLTRQLNNSDECDNEDLSVEAYHQKRQERDELAQFLREAATRTEFRPLYEEAIRRSVQKNEASLVRYAMSKGLPQTDAEECVGKLYVHIAEHLESIGLSRDATGRITFDPSGFGYIKNKLNWIIGDAQKKLAGHRGVQVSEFEQFVDKSLSPVLLAELSETAETSAQLENDERQVYELKENGLSLNAIAENLGISPRTVGTIWKRAQEKLGIYKPRKSFRPKPNSQSNVI